MCWWDCSVRRLIYTFVGCICNHVLVSGHSEVPLYSYYLSSKQQMCCSDCADAQADLHLCCLHMQSAGFLKTLGWVISYIWHSTNVLAEWLPFFSAARYMIGHFFQQKVYDWTDVFIGIWKAPLFWHPGICTYFSLIDFWGCLFSWYSMNWLQCLYNYQQ